MKRLILGGWLLLAISCQPRIGTANYAIVPRPDRVEVSQESHFTLTDSTPVVAPEELEHEASLLRQWIEESTHIAPQSEGTAAAIRLEVDSLLAVEGYRIAISESGITLKGGSSAGLFYGAQALRKSLPLGEFDRVELPTACIEAQPQYAYRGMHLDVARHFFDVEFIKRYIDLMALHGINRLHWHLTDDQGWRIEIKGYPRLCEVGAERKETVVGRNSSTYDGTPYGRGCYFTQEQAREVVRYAHERHIEVIPEIDMPGHMMAALSGYPELGCTQGPYAVWGRWGVSEEVLCAGNDKTLQFCRDVLDQMVEIFPSEWIHIGGDECPKVRWEQCTKCQARIREKGLHHAPHPEEALQGWFIAQMVDHLKSHGRTAIGWDELLDSDQPMEEVVVMSWRGEAGARRAAEQGLRSVMTAQNYLYFDHYQTRDNSREPLALGGFNPLDRVYGFDPRGALPDSLKQWVVGVQANLWSEYIVEPEHAFRMVLPRMAALSEIQWCAPEQRDYNDFLERLQRLLPRYTQLGYPYAPYILDVEYRVEADTTHRALKVHLSTRDNAPIRYTLLPNETLEAGELYREPITISSSQTLRAAALRQDSLSDEVPLRIDFSKATLCPITLQSTPSSQYTFAGESMLVDGLRGDRNYRTGRWLGFGGRDLRLVIDLKEVESVEEVAFAVCVNKDDGCFDARGCLVEGSLDGEHFRELHRADYPPLREEDDHGIYPHRERFAQAEARYLRITIAHEHSIPAWHPYFPGVAAFLFVDEILVQ